MDLGLAGKVVVITGGGHGIGRVMALEFSAEGATVVLAEVDPERGEKTAQEVRAAGGRALPITCDVSKEEHVRAVVQRALEELGHIDVLVNNAVSPLLTGSLEELGDDEWDDNFRVNVKGSFYFSKAVAGHMKQRRCGKIINMASLTGRRGSSPPTSAAYASSKGAIIAQTATLARELAPYNINVNAIAPGSINTPRWWAARTPEQATQALKAIPLGRQGEPHDIASIALFLASDASCYITGQTITADGGTACM